MSEVPSRFGSPPTAEQIAALADQALAAIPPRLLSYVRGVSIAVEEMPDEETLSDLGLESPWELTGLYSGTPLTLKSVDDTASLPDRIYLYRQPILLEWIETDVDLYNLVRNVVVHEIAHHFGFSDADIDAIESEMG